MSGRGLTHDKKQGVEACASEALERALEDQGFDLGPAEVDALSCYLGCLMTFRERLDLSGPVSVEDLVVRHVMDSLIGIRLLAPAKDARVADLGSGGGFPGVPCAIVRRDLDVTLIEARKKKAAFLESVAKACGARATVLPVRAEEAGRRESLRETFRYVLARALGKARVVVELGVPLLTVGGELAMWKGPAAIEEMEEAGRALKALGARLERVEEYRLPQEDIGRRLVVVKKVEATPAAYPRRAGVPEKRPL